MPKFPRDNAAALKAFYGDPGDHGPNGVAAQLVHITPPFQLKYDGKNMKPNQLLVHRKCATEFMAALNLIWDYYGHSQATIDKLHISWNSGTYVPRYVRGTEKTTKKWSNHAFGAAWDVDAEDNPLGSKNNKLPLVVVAAFKSQGASWGGDYESRKDNMHVEFCDRGGPKWTFQQWLTHYNQPPMGTFGASKTTAPDPVPAALPPPPADRPVPEFMTRGTSAVSTSGVRGDPEIWNAQRRLKDMSYYTADLDGVWGSQTAGAISGFVNDRQDATFASPASAEDFAKVLQQLKAALTKAEGEHFVRPVTAARANATEAQVAEKLPELAPVRKNRLAMIWTAITASVAAVFDAIVKNFQDALTYLQPVRDFFADIPGWMWFAAAAGVAYYIYRNSSLSATSITDAFKKGER